MEIMKRYARIEDPEILTAAYDLHVKLFPRVPEIRAEDLKLVLERNRPDESKSQRCGPGEVY
jgi:hypothetical protein